MKNRLLTLAGALLLLAVLGKFYAKPLLAQVRAALVENVDEPGRNPYQSTVRFDPVSNNCNATSCAVLTFATVPPQRNLVITHITGMVYIQTPGVVYELGLWNSTSDIYDYSLLPIITLPTMLQAGTIYGDNMIGIDSATQVYVPAGKSPTIELAVTTNLSVRRSNITISGYLVSLP